MHSRCQRLVEDGMNKDACETIWHRIQGLTIHTRVSTAVPSHAQDVVLIHGLGVSAEYMLPTLIRLGSRYQVWAPDLPGFGLSDKPKHRSTSQSWPTCSLNGSQR